MNNTEDVELRNSVCVFCDLSNVSGYEYVAAGVVMFTPLNPVTEGHKLFVAIEHSDNAGANPSLNARVFMACSEWAGQNYEEYNIITSAGENATQTVFHTHIHLVPRRKGDGLMLPWSKAVQQKASRREDVVYQQAYRAGSVSGKLTLLDEIEAIPSEVGKLANHSLRVSEFIKERRRQLEKGMQ